MNTRYSTIIAPSILSADFSAMGNAVRTIEESGADWVHVDIMDGMFVPNISFGSKMVNDLRPLTKLPLDVHLMIEKPERYIAEFAGAGADFITFHLEAAVHAHRLLDSIKKLGKKAGISIVPSTPAEALSEILELVDIILLMTVNPGFGGQKFIPQCIPKIEKLHRYRIERNLEYDIAVDGGINAETALTVREAGANVLITGSSFFSARDPAEEVLKYKGTYIV